MRWDMKKLFLRAEFGPLWEPWEEDEIGRKILGLAITELSKEWNPLVSWTNFVWENGGSFIYKNSVSFVAGISHISRNKRETLQSYKNIIEYNKNL